MKAFLPSIKNAFCSFLFLFLFIVTSSVYSQDKGSAEVGMIKKTTGKVWLHHAGKKIAATRTMDLFQGDLLEIEEQASALIVYFKNGKKEEYTSRSLIEIGIDKSVIKDGNAISAGQEIKEKKIIVDTPAGSLDLKDKDIAHAGGQFIRGILPPKQYFDDHHIQRFAVVVGISDYSDPKIPDLKYADADAQAFYNFITSPLGGDFKKENVLLLKNQEATLKNVKLAVTNFLKMAIDSDFVVIFMACHGEPEPDRPNNIYLLMHDTELDSLSATAYHLENINADMKRYISAKRLIFFADACHSGGMGVETAGTRGFSNTVNVALSELKSTREGWGIISASRAGEVSMESNQWGGGHGVFTHYLLEGMSGKADEEGNKNGIVTLVEAFDYLGDRVKRATKSAQHPDTSGNFDNNIPLGFPGTKTASDEKVQTVPASRLGTLQIGSNPEGAVAYVGGNEIGTTPLQTKLASGTYSVLVKMKNRPEAEQTAFINPDETTDMYFDLTGGKIRGTEGGKNEAVTSGDAQLEYAETSADRENKQKTKENVDTLIKELESMVKEQSDEGELKTAKKAKKSRKETVEAAQGIPISLKEFTVKMGTLSHRRDMERLRQRIIDSLLSQKGLSVVERELEFQEEILREQRLSGSILADKLFRVALGKIQGAAFLCFGGVSSGDASDQLVLRMEIVDTATTLIETLEYPFKADDNLRIVADNVAAKIREKIAAKRKL